MINCFAIDADVYLSRKLAPELFLSQSEVQNSESC